jgi:hypothetical protein
VQSAGRLSATDLHCTDPALGYLSIHHSINAHELANWVFVLYFGDIGQPCVGRSSHTPKLEKARILPAVILAYDYVPCRLVGSNVDRNRLDVREGCGVAASANIAAYWCLRGTE